MTITNADAIDTPADMGLITVHFAGSVAKSLVAMLNMNKVRDYQGCRIVFSWQRIPDTDEWLLLTTRYAE